jgi:hypothetical protein
MSESRKIDPSEVITKLSRLTVDIKDWVVEDKDDLIQTMNDAAKIIIHYTSQESVMKITMNGLRDRIKHAAVILTGV